VLVRQWRWPAIAIPFVAEFCILAIAGRESNNLLKTK